MRKEMATTRTKKTDTGGAPAEKAKKPQARKSAPAVKAKKAAPAKAAAKKRTLAVVQADATPAPRRGGRYLVVGFASGEIPSIALNLPLLKQVSIVGVFWGSFAAREPERNRAHIDQLLSWLTTGRLRSRISARFLSSIMTSISS